MAYSRPPAAFRNAHLLERPRTNWAFTIVRQYLYDQFDHLRLEALAESSLAPLAQATAKILREEKYHIMYGETWMARLTGGDAATRDRVTAALTLAWPDVLGLFEPLPGKNCSSRGGICRAQWRRFRRPGWNGSGGAAGLGAGAAGWRLSRDRRAARAA